MGEIDKQGLLQYSKAKLGWAIAFGDLKGEPVMLEPHQMRQFNFKKNADSFRCGLILSYASM